MGPTTSPLIFAVPAMDPIQDFVRGGDEGGTISAMGLPNFVTRIGSRVLRTRSRTARHVALNFEMVISSVNESYHSQEQWSDWEFVSNLGSNRAAVLGGADETLFSRRETN